MLSLLVFLLAVLIAGGERASPYLGHHADATSPAIATLLHALHRQQHPPSASEPCTSRRLLVTRLDNKFEGLASVVLQIVMGLAEAAWSNRTLVFGPDLPYMFEESREEWLGVDGLGGAPAAPAAAATLTLPNGTTPSLSCSDWPGRGGGPFSCFFLPLSACTLSHLSPQDLRGLGLNGFNDSARVKLMEPRRGIAAYHAPLHNPAFAKAFATASGAHHPHHTWAAALAAYVFRLQPNVQAILEARRAAMLAGSSSSSKHASTITACAGKQRQQQQQQQQQQQPVQWGMHVRAGDIKALAHVYSNRKVFSFEQMMEEVTRMSRDVALPSAASDSSSSSSSSSSALAPPSHLYIASDGPANEWVQDLCSSSSSSSSSWPPWWLGPAGAPPPPPHHLCPPRPLPHPPGQPHCRCQWRLH